jgi:hypothetical protein
MPHECEGNVRRPVSGRLMVLSKPSRRLLTLEKNNERTSEEVRSSSLEHAANCVVISHFTSSRGVVMLTIATFTMR